jgi:3-phosphoshikimate 1-carboxyvinyltransferase
MNQRFEQIDALRGELKLAGDKSISHRSVMFAAMADGNSLIQNCSESEDVTSTMNCFEKLGCKFERDGNIVRVSGLGYRGFSAPNGNLDAGNSGTTARLITGILAAQKFVSILVGDESLSNRPMKRVVDPLRLMGAKLEPTIDGTLPMRIFPTNSIRPINYKLQVASAQVKSAMLLCALHLEEESTIIETVPTRNHTEVMLGLRTEQSEEGTRIFASKKNYPRPLNITVPADISSAAFFMVASCLAKNSEVVLKNVSLNPTRTGIIKTLQNMGGKIEILCENEEGSEKVGDIKITSSILTNAEIPSQIIPNIIDEIPILAVAGIYANGKFKISGAKELRVKESDRIKSLCENFRMIGLEVTEFEDGFEIDGSIKEGNYEFESFGDHRIAMAFSVLSILMKNGGVVKNYECCGISNPKFFSQIQSLAYNSNT